MDKFEKLLGLFVCNPYPNIQLSDLFEKTSKDIFLFSFLFIPLALMQMILSYPYNAKSFNNESLEIINYIHTYIWLVSLIVFYSYYIVNYFLIKYVTKYLMRIGAISLYLMFMIIFSIPLGGLFIVDNIQFFTVLMYDSIFIFLIIFYSYYYYKKWEKLIVEKYYEQIKRRLINNNFYFNSGDKLFKFDLNEIEKDKPKLTKIAEIVVGFMMRFGFTLPILAVLASTGTGGNGIIYFSIYLMFFIIPELIKTIVRPIAFNKFIKQIEKEKNVTIYNGKLISSN